MFICQFVSLAINPWYLLGSASIFVQFLGSYQIFLSAITGVLLCNYYIISRGYFKIPDLYTADKSGVYYFTHGWNIRAYIAYIVAIIPNFPGFLGNMGVSMPIGITRFYIVAYPVGIILSFSVFWLCNIIKAPALKMPLNEWHEPKNYIRPEEDTENGVVVEGIEADQSSSTGSGPAETEKQIMKETTATKLE